MMFSRRRPVPKWYQWRRRRALRSAMMLDQMVDAQAPLLPWLSDSSRRRSADHLASLAMLGQDYRAFAAGWISHAELEHRGAATLERIACSAADRCRGSMLEQLTERD